MFSRFPSDPDMKKAWIIACKRMKLSDKSSFWEPQPHDSLCSKHFKETDYISTATRKRLKATAVPSVFDHSDAQPSTSSRTLRYVQSYGQVPVVINPAPQEETAKLKRRIEELTKTKKNANKREKRLRRTVSSLKEELVTEKHLTKELSSKLDAYSGELTVPDLYSLCICFYLLFLVTYSEVIRFIFTIYNLWISSRDSVGPFQTWRAKLYSRNAQFLPDDEPLQQESLWIRQNEIAFAAYSDCERVSYNVLL